MAGPEGYWEKRKAEGKKPQAEMRSWEKLWHATREVAHKLKTEKDPSGF
ncbi:MAG: hypothetical protein KBD05_00015 [Candidatus Pacebacteria bacterium]|nr:hypothetical protein [Candidatus Paceibacterota bacterium]